MKHVAILLILVLPFSSACGKKKKSSAPPPSSTTTTTTQAPPPQQKPAEKTWVERLPETLQPQSIFTAGLLYLGIPIAVHYKWDMNYPIRSDGDYGEYVLHAKEGQEYVIRSSRQGTVLYLLNFGLQILKKSDESALSPTVTFAPTRSGLYTLRVRAIRQGDQGTTILTLSKHDRTTETVDATKPASGEGTTGESAGPDGTATPGRETVPPLPKPEGTAKVSGRIYHGLPMNRAGVGEVQLPDEIVTFERFSVGFEHTLAVKDGAAYALGSNRNGQMGIDKTPNEVPESKEFTKITSLTGVRDVAAGVYHSVALRSDGTVWTWGSNSEEQLGYLLPEDPARPGALPVSFKPKQVPDLKDIVEIRAGGFFTLARDSKNDVWVWGANKMGQLATGSTEPRRRAKPQRIAKLAGATAIGAGREHAIALVKGAVYVWGANNVGQLGLGTVDKDAHPTPAEIPNFLATAVAVGRDHSLAISGGLLYGWGVNNAGQLGFAADVDSHPERRAFPTLTNVLSVRAFSDRTVAYVR